MIDFTPVFTRTATFDQLVGQLTIAELRALTNESIDAMLSLIANCTDADAVFVPNDPSATDGPGWPLSHIIVHATASAEEMAFLAAEQARGVADHGRSRYETDWETVTTIAQCRSRLEESRRIRLASLEIWPDQPHLENMVEISFLGQSLNAKGRFALGLAHDGMHIPQIAEAAKQAEATRNAV
jgi:hypothetical protein